jgi:hypothetical protein
VPGDAAEQERSTLHIPHQSTYRCTALRRDL